MAAQVAHNANNVSADTLITIKVSVNESLKKLKLPLRDLGANVLPDKVRLPRKAAQGLTPLGLACACHLTQPHRNNLTVSCDMLTVSQLRILLGIKPEQSVVFERFSDSAGGYITLDPNNPQVFKTLIRAAKAKLKLRLKATVSPLPEQEQQPEPKKAEEKIVQKPMEPVIVRSPVYQPAPRDSTAFDRRSVGSGIFQFRESMASQQTLVDTSEAPVPRPFDNMDNKSLFNKLAEQASPRGLAFRTREPPAIVNTSGHPWSVYCNECDAAMPDGHFHCSICDGGDYDLCERCVASGKLCPGEGHWLIKRFIKGWQGHQQHHGAHLASYQEASANQ